LSNHVVANRKIGGTGVSETPSSPPRKALGAELVVRQRQQRADAEIACTARSTSGHGKPVVMVAQTLTVSVTR